MKALRVAQKALLEIFREPALLLLVVSIPLIFIVITWAGYANPLLLTHPVLVWNTAPNDTALVDELASLRYADDRPVFNIKPAGSLEQAEKALRDQTATLLIKMEPGSANLPKVSLRGDAVNLRYLRASVLADTTINHYLNRLSGRTEIITIREQPLFSIKTISEFDLYTPGMIIFGLLLIIPQTAVLVGREVRSGTLKRLALTPLSALELFSGISLAQMAVAVLQVVLVLGGAILLGFHNNGSLLLAVVAGLVLCFGAIGQGLLTACFIENDSQAVNVGSVFSMLQVFFSGSMYILPAVTLFSLGGYAVDLFDLFPATHAFLVLQQVLVYGVGWVGVLPRLLATLLTSLVYFVLGVVLFQRLKMR
jgi:ABC-2 type transport system permease protein